MLEGESIVLDTSTLIAYLSGGEAVSALASDLFDGMVRAARNPAIVPASAVAELMVRPMIHGPEATSAVTAFLLGFPGLTIRSVDFLVAVEAARIRALTGTTTPDALIAATATLTSSRWLVTNDRTLGHRLAKLDWETEVVVLGDAMTP